MKVQWRRGNRVQDLRHIIDTTLDQIPMEALMSGNMPMAIMGQTRLPRHVCDLFGAEGHPAMDGHDVMGQDFSDAQDYINGGWWPGNLFAKFLTAGPIYVGMTP